MFHLILDKALEKAGTSKALAIELDVNPPDISKFRSGDVGMKIDKLERLLELSGLDLIPADERKNLINAAMTFADLYKNKK